MAEAKRQRMRTWREMYFAVGFVSFGIPAGKTRIVEANSIAVFGEDLPPAGSLSNDATITMSEAACGFGFAAILTRL